MEGTHDFTPMNLASTAAAAARPVKNRSDLGTDYAIAYQAMNAVRYVSTLREEGFGEVPRPSEALWMDPVGWFVSQYGDVVHKLGPVALAFICSLGEGDLFILSKAAGFEKFKNRLNRMLYVADVFMVHGHLTLKGMSDEDLDAVTLPPATSYLDPEAVLFERVMQDGGSSDLEFADVVIPTGKTFGSWAADEAGPGTVSGTGVLPAIPGQPNPVLVGDDEPRGYCDYEPSGTLTGLNELGSNWDYDEILYPPYNICFFDQGPPEAVPCWTDRQALIEATNDAQGKCYRFYMGACREIAVGCDPAVAQFVESARYPQDIRGRKLSVTFSKEAEAEDLPRLLRLDRLTLSLCGNLGYPILQAYMGNPIRHFPLPTTHWVWSKVFPTIAFKTGVVIDPRAKALRVIGRQPFSNGVVMDHFLYFTKSVGHLKRSAHALAIRQGCAVDLAFIRQALGYAPGPSMANVAGYLAGSKHYAAIRALGYGAFLPQFPKLNSMVIRLVPIGGYDSPSSQTNDTEKTTFGMRMMPWASRVIVFSARHYPIELREEEDVSNYELRWMFRLAYILAHRSIGSPLFCNSDCIGDDILILPSRYKVEDKRVLNAVHYGVAPDKYLHDCGWVYDHRDYVNLCETGAYFGVVSAPLIFSGKLLRVTNKREIVRAPRDPVTIFVGGPDDKDPDERGILDSLSRKLHLREGGIRDYGVWPSRDGWFDGGSVKWVNRTP